MNFARSLKTPMKTNSRQVVKRDIREWEEHQYGWTMVSFICGCAFEPLLAQEYERFGAQCLVPTAYVMIVSDEKKH